MRWYFCWLGRGRVYILHVKQTWITWDQKVGLVAGLQDSSEFLRQFAPVIPAVWYSYPWVAPSFTILQLVCVINSSQQKWCYVISEKRLWKIVTSIWISPIPASPPPQSQSWVTPCWRSSFPDVHSPKKIPPGRNIWPGTLAASGWRRELGSEFFNPTPALTSW